MKQEGAARQFAGSAPEKRDDMLERMRQYARLLIRVGVNIQKGQNLVLLCPVEDSTRPSSVRTTA